MTKIINVVGARPNFMKIAPLYRAMKRYSHRIKPRLVHTGQHYDYLMSKIFFDQLKLPKPDIYLGVGSDTHGKQTGKIIIKFEEVLQREKPDLVIVVGDTNSTLACAVATGKLLVPLVHVEAGLRSYDRSMPEEINRIVTDTLSDLLFTTCRDADLNLKKEGISPKKTFLVGNVMIDTLLANLSKVKRINLLPRLGLVSQNYAVLTLHRPSNVDKRSALNNLAKILKEVSQEIDIIFPIHPRTEKQIARFGLKKYFRPINSLKSSQKGPRVFLINPLGYLQFINLMLNAKFVLTDSGGVQEETTELGIPCLTLRENTERPITVREGTNTVTGTNREKIAKNVSKILSGKYKKGKIPALWDGKSAERIVKIILRYRKV